MSRPTHRSLTVASVVTALCIVTAPSRSLAANACPQGYSCTNDATTIPYYSGYNPDNPGNYGVIPKASSDAPQDTGAHSCIYYELSNASTC